MTRPRQQQGPFPAIAGEGGSVFELGAGLLYPVKSSEQAAACAGQQMVVRQYRLLEQDIV
ncbi:hypothetical protein [Pistricoccus aurantiacus]|uniref:hypothetical protein n=1 Tax=Pistricoccus aurantiacus TaxID=1883414 RepID=UPI001646E3B0|nr:hypothetical protein [Pistricoccus aurantiacus]